MFLVLFVGFPCSFVVLGGLDMLGLRVFLVIAQFVSVFAICRLLWFCVLDRLIVWFVVFVGCLSVLWVTTFLGFDVIWDLCIWVFFGFFFSFGVFVLSVVWFVVFL